MQNIEFILYVSDQAISRDFYSKLFGKNPVLDVPGMTEFEINQYTKLGLMPEEGIHKLIGHVMPGPSTANGIPRCELYLFVNDPEMEVQNAVHCGGLLISHAEERNWGHKVGYIADTDGHVIAFASVI